MNRITIAAAQSHSSKGDISANVQTHAEFIQTAGEHNVDLLIFPELSLTGYEPELAPALTLSLDDNRLTPLADLARNSRMTIIVGAPVSTPHGKPYIGALVLGNTKPLIYLKRHLHRGEDEFFTPGSEDCLIDVKGVRIGLAVCADIAVAWHASEAAGRGASIYAAAVLITSQGYSDDAALLRTYAQQHHMAVLMANHGGPTGRFVPAGRSAIWDGNGQLIAQADEIGQTLVLACQTETGWHGKVVPLSRPDKE